MKPPAIIGILFLIVGLAAFTYATHEKGIDLGIIQVTADEQDTAPLPPVVGVGALIGGFLLLFHGRNSSEPPSP
jgi:hypothetical protein